MKKNANDISECSTGLEGHETAVQLGLEGMWIALHNRSPGSDYMCYLRDIQGKVVNAGLRLRT